MWDIHEGVDNLPSTCCIIEGIEEFWRGNTNLVAMRTPWQLHGTLWNFTFKLWLKAFVRVGKKSPFSFFGQKLNNVIINLSFKNGQNVIKFIYICSMIYEFCNLIDSKNCVIDPYIISLLVKLTNPQLLGSLFVLEPIHRWYMSLPRYHNAQNYIHEHNSFSIMCN